eukprot:GHVT01010099.1.p1 GENE.GHVT01010099.1~~GHVT01010099.1.p1  ORF type:complete len:309 (+),score=48.46 GHVT01010099.1:1462-2388(+)
MDFVTARFASGGSTTEVTEADLRQTARKAKKAHKNRSAPAQASAPSSALAILGSVVMIGAVVGAASYLMPSAPKTEVIQNNQNVYVVKPDTTVASNNVQPLITHQIPTMQVRQPATVDVMDIPQVRHYSNQLAKEHGWNYMQQCTEPNTATQLRGHRRLAVLDKCKQHLALVIGALVWTSLQYVETQILEMAGNHNASNGITGATLSQRPGVSGGGGTSEIYTSNSPAPTSVGDRVGVSPLVLAGAVMQATGAYRILPSLVGGLFYNGPEGGGPLYKALKEADDEDKAVEENENEGDNSNDDIVPVGF